MDQTGSAAGPGAGAGPATLAVLAALFALSGCASLMDQVVWLRYLGLTFGNTTYAAATLLAVFLGGLALGALLFGRWADRLRRPLTALAVVEIAVALIALASPHLFGLIDAAYVQLYRGLGSRPALFAVGRAVLAALVLLPPTLLMGGTLPLILRAAVARGGRGADPAEARRTGRATALFYAVNTLGATAGVALAGLVTIRLLGLAATLVVAAAIDLVVGLGCALLSRPLPPAPPPAPPRRGPAPPAGVLRDAGGLVSRPALLALFFAMGATSLAYEVLWTRVLVFYLGSSVYAYSLMLVVILLGIGAGSLAATPWADRVASPRAALVWLEGGIAAWALVQVLLFERLNAAFAAGAELLKPASFAGLSGVQLLCLLPILLPPTLLMGASFPLAVRAASRGADRLGSDVGAVYFANTLGAVAGSLATGFLLIPLAGTQDSLLLAGAANGALAAAFALGRPLAAPPATPAPAGRRAWRWAWLIVPAAAVAAVPRFPPDALVLSAGMFRDDRPGDLLYFDEDASATVTIRRLRAPAAGPYLSLELNGVNVAGTSADNFAVQKLQGHLPLLLVDRLPEAQVLHIGLGSGATAHAVSLHPVGGIQVVEISPAVPRAAREWFHDLNRGVLDDRRLTLEVNDGRNFLLATPRRFDAILSDSIHPRYSGNGSLYTREYFRLLRRRLAPGGAVSMWLPMYSLTPLNYAMILRAFVDAFPEAAVWYEPSALNSFTVVTGRAGPPAWSAETLRAAFADRRVGAELATLGIREPGDVLACYLLGGEELRRWLEPVPAHTDDLPAVEYDSGSLLARDFTWLANFSLLLERRPAEPPAAYLAALGPAERERARARFAANRAVMDDHRDFLARQLGLGEVPTESPPAAPAPP
jgi:spermidine synthase